MIRVYSKDNCPHCVTAQTLLESRGIPYEVLKLGVDYTAADLQAIVPGARTVPQIIAADGSIIGGLTDLQKSLTGA